MDNFIKKNIIISLLVILAVFPIFIFIAYNYQNPSTIFEEIKSVLIYLVVCLIFLFIMLRTQLFLSYFRVHYIIPICIGLVLLIFFLYAQILHLGEKIVSGLYAAIAFLVVPYVMHQKYDD